MLGSNRKKVKLDGAYCSSTGDFDPFYALFRNYADLFCQVQGSNTSGSSSNNSPLHYSDNFGHLCQYLILPQGLLYSTINHTAGGATGDAVLSVLSS